MLVYITSMESTQSFYLALYVKLELLWLNIWGRLQHFPAYFYWTCIGHDHETNTDAVIFFESYVFYIYISNPMFQIYVL